MRCAWASIDENGNVSGGQAGDQTGKEVKIGNYYQFNQTTIYRFIDRDLAVKYATFIEKVCKNNNVGYNQAKRTTLYKQAKKVGYNPSLIQTACDCDCSSLVACGLVAVGVNVPYTMTTSSINTYLDKLTDQFTKITDSDSLAGTGLMAGDIVNAPGHHVISVLNDTEAEDDSLTYIHKNNYLTTSEMRTNAKYIANKLYNVYGWSINAIAGLLGNTQTESNHNPELWQSLKEGNEDGGFGLCQWTPATKILTYLNEKGLEIWDMDGQLERLEYERVNHLQYYSTSSYPISFDEFIHSDLEPSYLGMTWMYNYERPENLNQTKRGTQAESWYNLIVSNNWCTGYQPDTDEPTDNPDISDIVGDGEDVYNYILDTSYNIKQLTTEELSYIKSVKIGDTCRMKYTFNRDKKTVGKNICNKKLTFDNKVYIIAGVETNGFLKIYSTDKRYPKRINPKYIKEV